MYVSVCGVLQRVTHGGALHVCQGVWKKVVGAGQPVTVAPVVLRGRQQGGAHACSKCECVLETEGTGQAIPHA